MTQFRSASMAQRWAELYKERQTLIEGKSTAKIDDKIDVLSSFMASCKPGFTMSDAKIKKAIKFIKEHTGKSRAKYGSIPEGSNQHTILFKDVVLLYTEQDGKIIFRDHEEK